MAPSSSSREKLRLHSLYMLHSTYHWTSRAAVTLRFPPTKARTLRFRVREGKPWDFSLPDWSLPELRLYRECALPH